MRFHEKPCGFREFRLGAVLIHDPDALEDGLIEFPTHLVAGGSVHLIGIAQEFQPSLEVVRADADVVVDRRETCLQPGALPLDLGDLLASFGTSESTVSDEIDQVVCASLESNDLALDLVAHLALGPGLVPQHAVDLGVHPLDELSAQLHSAVVLDDLVLDEVERKVTRVADALLATPAEEVKVLATQSSNRALNQHSLRV